MKRMATIVKLGFLALSILMTTACATTPTPTTVLPATPTRVPTVAPTVFAPQPSATGVATSKPVASATKAPVATAAKSPTLTPTRAASPNTTSWYVRTILIGPGQPGRLYALLVDYPYSLAEVQRARLIISDDSAATWTLFAGGIPVAPACLRNINLDYAARDALYASTCQGLYAWSNNEWKQISSKETSMVAIVYGQPKNMWGLDQRGSIVKSVDSGKTWQPSATGPVTFSGLANLAIDPREPNLLYGIINPKYAGTYLRRGKADGNWDFMPTPMNNAQIETGMTIDGATGDLYVTARNVETAHWGVWRSRNPSVADINSVAWESVYEFGDDLWASILASGTTPQGLALYVRLTDFDNNRTALMRSLDSGKTWKTIEIR